MGRLEELLEALKVPFNHLPRDGGGKELQENPSLILATIREKCMTLLHGEMMEESNRKFLEIEAASESWKLTCVLLDTVLRLKKELEIEEEKQSEEEKSIEVLSLQSQMDFQKCIELVLGFGTLPYMMPGIGIPPKLRRNSALSDIFILHDRQISDFEKFQRLAHVLEILLTVLDHPSLRTLIFNEKVVCDIVASCLQICKAPIRPPGMEGSLDVRSYNIAMSARERVWHLFQRNFLKKISKATLVNSLLIVGANERPRWMSKACNDQLLEILLSSDENGLATISQTVLDSLGRSNLWKVSRVIINLVKITIEKEQGEAKVRILESLSHQAVVMLEHFRARLDLTCDKADEENCEDMINTAVTIGAVLYESNSEISVQHFWSKVFKPILWGSESLEPRFPGAPTIKIKDVEACASYAEKLLKISHVAEFTIKCDAFLSLWTSLLQLFVCCEDYLWKRLVQDPEISTPLEPLHKKMMETILSLFEVLHQQSNLKLSKDSDCKSSTVDCIEFCTRLITNEDYGDSKRLTKCCKIGNQIIFDAELPFPKDDGTCTTPSPEEIIFIGKIVESKDEIEYIESKCEILASRILINERLRQFSKSLFSSLLGHADLHKLDDLRPSEKTGSNKAGTSKLLTELDIKEFLETRKFVQMKILGELGSHSEIVEEIESAEDPEQMLNYLELIMKKLTDEMECSEDRGNEYEFGQSALFSLGILGTICESKCDPSKKNASKSSTSDWESLYRFLPYLKKFRETGCVELMNFGVPDMAEDVIISIKTHGAGMDGDVKPQLTRYQKAIEDAQSPMIPIKGHGLLELRRLIKEKDEDALKNESSLLQLFQKEMKHTDSYIYLMAIEGLASLGSKFHSTVVPVLIQEYGCFDDTNSEKITSKMTNQERVELRMKIGEVLVKIIQSLGAIAPKYRNNLTNVFFHVVRDVDPVLQASALSNLGELCHLLGYSLSTVLTEVWSCIESVLMVEKNPTVRRAATHLLVLLLRGIEKQFSVDSLFRDASTATYLRDARRVLTRVHDNETDDTTKIQIQLALQEMELIVQKLITPNPSLEYKIRVLGAD